MPPLVAKRMMKGALEHKLEEGMVGGGFKPESDAVVCIATGLATLSAGD